MHVFNSGYFHARLHVPPKRFVRIRHFGFLSNRFRTTQLVLSRQLLVTIHDAVRTATSG